VAIDRAVSDDYVTAIFETAESFGSGAPDQSLSTDQLVASCIVAALAFKRLERDDSFDLEAQLYDLQAGLGRLAFEPVLLARLSGDGVGLDHLIFAEEGGEFLKDWALRRLDLWLDLDD
jgi:hypothetical protein